MTKEEEAHSYGRHLGSAHCCLEHIGHSNGSLGSSSEWSSVDRKESFVGGLIFLALLVGIMVMFPPSAIIIIPFVVISILVGLGMRSIGESMTEPVRSEVRESAERIAEAIESLRSEHDHPDTEPEDEDEDESGTEPEIDPPATQELMEEIESFLQEGSR